MDETFIKKVFQTFTYFLRFTITLEKHTDLDIIFLEFLTIRIPNLLCIIMQ
jgi:hypothetical protein